MKTVSTRESRHWVNVGKYRNYDNFCTVIHGKYYNLTVWRIIIKILKLIYFSVEACESVVAINYQQRDSMLPSKRALESNNLQAARKNGEGRPENFPPTLPNIINENYILLRHFFLVTVSQHLLFC